MNDATQYELMQQMLNLFDEFCRNLQEQCDIQREEIRELGERVSDLEILEGGERQ
jgi:hypothetical protein